jgi:hypothetical protein
MRYELRDYVYMARLAVGVLGNWKEVLIRVRY